MIKIRNIFETKKSGNSYISKGVINPCRDWLILIVLLFIMIISSIFFDVLFYQKILKGEMYVSVEEDELTLVMLEKDELKKIVDKFEAKKEYISKMKIESLIDPSI